MIYKEKKITDNINKNNFTQVLHFVENLWKECNFYILKKKVNIFVNYKLSVTGHLHHQTQSHWAEFALMCLIFKVWVLRSCISLLPHRLLDHVPTPPTPFINNAQVKGVITHNFTSSGFHNKYIYSKLTFCIYFVSTCLALHNYCFFFRKR